MLKQYSLLSTHMKNLQLLVYPAAAVKYGKYSCLLGVNETVLAPSPPWISQVLSTFTTKLPPRQQH